MKAKIVSEEIKPQNLWKRFKDWLNSAGELPTSRSSGAILLMAALGALIYVLWMYPGTQIHDLIATVLFGLIGFAGSLYATGEGQTWSAPVGTVRAIIVLICFFILFWGPNLGERPILFEMIAVAFGRSLKE